MTSISNSKTTSGKNTFTSSPNTYSYQVTSQFASSGSPGTCNSYDSQNLQNMLDYALQSKRLPQKQVIKRELLAHSSNQLSSLTSQDSKVMKQNGPIKTPPNVAIKAKPAVEKLPDGAIVIQPTGGELYTGKGKGKRKKKNNKQIQMLQKAYRARNDWNRDDIINLAKFTGLTKSQIYKWNWDIRKRGKYREQDWVNQKSKASDQNLLPFIPGGFGNKNVNLQALPEYSETSENKSCNQLPKIPSLGNEKKIKAKTKKTFQSSKNPYLQQLPQVKAFQVGKIQKSPKIVKKTTMNVNKKLDVKALETKFKKINLESSNASDSKFSHTAENTPISKTNANFIASDTEIRTENEEELKQEQSEKYQPPPSTPMYQQIFQYKKDDVNGNSNTTLLRCRNYAEANFEQDDDDDAQSVPNCILENQEGEDCQENINNYLEQRQRSNSLGALTSQQTMNYLDEFLLQNQSNHPYSKKPTYLVPPQNIQNQQFFKNQASDVISINHRFVSKGNQQNTGSAFKQASLRLDSLSSGNTAFKFSNNDRPGVTKSQDRQSSESSWKLAFRQPQRRQHGGYWSQFTGVRSDQKSGEVLSYKLPQDLSAQARIGQKADESSVRWSISGSYKNNGHQQQRKFKPQQSIDV